MFPGPLSVQPYARLGDTESNWGEPAVNWRTPGCGSGGGLEKAPAGLGMVGVCVLIEEEALLSGPQGAGEEGGRVQFVAFSLGARTLLLACCVSLDEVRPFSELPSWTW